MVFLSEEAKELANLLESRRYAKAHAWLNRVCPEQLEGEDARICLTAALYATPKLFRRILQRCPPGEYSGQIQIAVKEGVNAYVYGTILTLAAALNKPDHVRILLDAGYGPNSAGVASAAAFQPNTFWFASGKPAPCGDCIAVNGNRLCFSGKMNWLIENVTPLAAAVACGSREAAAVLLRCPGVWAAESGVVCRAAVSALQMFPDDPRQQLVGMVFGKTRCKTFDSGGLARSCDLQIEYSVDFCAYDLLENQIQHGFCEEQGARAALKLLEEPDTGDRRPVRARMRKMSLLVRQFPALGKEAWVAGIFLRELVRRYTPEKPHVRLVRQWKHLCGGEGDLTWACMELYRMPRPQLQSLLKELSKDMHLVMDADSFGPFGRDSKWELTDILSHVELRHNRGLEGISSAANAVLRISGDRRFLRKAAKLGVFAGEDTKALLDHLNQIDRNDLRALVLSYGGQSDVSRLPRWKTEYRGGLWHRRWSIEKTDYARWLQQLIDEELSEEACLQRLQVMNYSECVKEFWHMDCSIPITLTDHPNRKEVKIAQPEAAVCCGTQMRPLQMMMQFMPEKLEKRYDMDFGDRKLLNLSGTPLTLAAAAGRTELVQLLLDTGLDPDERGRGITSSLRWYSCAALPLTPVMAAIYYGEEETAKQLLDAGAVCDSSGPLFQELLKRGNEQTREVAFRLTGATYDAPIEEPVRSMESLADFLAELNLF